MNKFHVQIISIVVVFALLGAVIIPNSHTGQIHESIGNFAKSVAMVFLAILTGTMPTDGQGVNAAEKKVVETDKEEGETGE